MKKLLSIILAGTLLLSLAVFPAFAESETSNEPSWYLQRLFVHYPDTKDAYDYGELFYSEIGEMDVDCDDAMDYAIIYSHLSLAAEALDCIVIGDRFIAQNYIYYPFRFGYALYDIENDKFIPLYSTIIEDYPFMEDYMDKFKIGSPFGDADCDGTLSVLDATYIQRVIAELEEFKRFEDISYYALPTDYRSDINLDNKVDIFDATAIQMKLAKVES